MLKAEVGTQLQRTHVSILKMIMTTKELDHGAQKAMTQQDQLMDMFRLIWVHEEQFHTLLHKVRKYDAQFCYIHECPLTYTHWAKGNDIISKCKGTIVGP